MPVPTTTETISATKIAQEKLQGQQADPAKQGASKFDQVLTNRLQQLTPATKAQSPSAVDVSRKADPSAKATAPDAAGDRAGQLATQKADAPKAADAATKVAASEKSDQARASRSATVDNSAPEADKVDEVDGAEEGEDAARFEDSALASAPSTDTATARKVTAQLNALDGPAAQAESAKHEAGNMVTFIGKVMEDMERGQGVMDKLIQAGINGKEFSSSELLVLQAGMYKYTQELELTGKVVEKATSGLRDTLKTQV